MRNKTLSRAFEALSLGEAYSGKYAYLGYMPDKELELLKAICKNAPKSIAEAFKFLEKKDELFLYIYDSYAIMGGEEYFIYPFADERRLPEGLSMEIGPIGAQNSQFHAENLSEHVAMVQVNLEEAGIPREIAAKIAVLHDVGKKYTSATNRVGDIASYGHADVSAFIASHWLKQWDIEEQDAKVLVAVIYAHMKPFNDWRVRANHSRGAINKKQGFYLQLIDLMGDEYLANKTMDLISLVARADEGVQEIDDYAISKIIKGSNILLDLNDNL
ncbi:HD domain-containing protein [Candidatus Saccharibacteria bacterium]|nr:HD domain-containing protein [Candidatus Saccharibacteria bacterium]